MQPHCHCNCFSSWLKEVTLACAPVTFSPRRGDIPYELGLLPPGLVSILLKKLSINSRRTARILGMGLSQVLGVCEFNISFGVLYLNGHARCTWKHLSWFLFYVLLLKQMTALPQDTHARPCISLAREW